MIFDFWICLKPVFPLTNPLASATCICSLKGAHDKTASRFGLEPGRFGWHDQVGVGHIEQLVDGARVHRDRSHAVSFASSDKFLVASDASYEVHSIVTLDVLDAQNLSQHMLVDDLTVELRHRGTEVDFVLLDGHDIPFAVNVEAVRVTRLHLGVFPVSQWTDCEVLLQGPHELLSGHIIQRLEYTVVIQDQ